MKLLYFAPHQIWPLSSGARLRDFQLARQLALHFSITFVEMRRTEEEPHIPPNNSGLAGIVTLDIGQTYAPGKILRGLVGPTPITSLNYWSLRSASQLAAVLKSSHFQSVQIEGTQLMEYLPIIQDAPSSPAIVVDWHNIESEMMWRYAKTTRNWAKKIAAGRTAKLIERAEDRLLGSNLTHTVTSERERQKLLARCPQANIHVIPNGVDPSFYTAKQIDEACRRNGHGAARPSILYVGSMDYHANIDAVTWFLRTAWPEIAQANPSLHFTIVGRDPSREVRALASDRIHVTGTVDDVRPYYASAVAAIVPLRSGSGTRLKVLEAMAAGVPVVSTRLGAEGIDAEDDVHLLHADTGPEIAAAVHRIVLSAETRSRLSQAARELVSQVYDWSVIGKQLCALHEEVAESRSVRSLCKVS
jgi:polysaccharide biosynthesis protein PslH